MFSSYLQVVIQETRLQRRSYQHCAEISVCLLKHSCTEKTTEEGMFYKCTSCLHTKKTFFNQKCLQKKRKSTFKHPQDVCGLFSIPTIIFTTMSPLAKLIKPAGMNLKELRNLSPITTVRVPEVPSESQTFLGF